MRRVSKTDKGAMRVDRQSEAELNMISREPKPAADANEVPKHISPTGRFSRAKVEANRFEQESLDPGQSVSFGFENAHLWLTQSVPALLDVPDQPGRQLYFS